jgi:hypothetical protein
LQDLSKTYTKKVINKAHKRAQEQYPELFKSFEDYSDKLNAIMSEVIKVVNEQGFVDDAPQELDDNQIDLF